MVKNNDYFSHNVVKPNNVVNPTNVVKPDNDTLELELIGNKEVCQKINGIKISPPCQNLVTFHILNLKFIMQQPKFFL